MSKTIKDGWHEIDSCTSVYTEDGRILRAIHNNLSASVYKRLHKNCRNWMNACGVKYNTFYKGYKEDRYRIM